MSKILLKYDCKFYLERLLPDGILIYSKYINYIPMVTAKYIPKANMNYELSSTDKYIKDKNTEMVTNIKQVSPPIRFV